MVGGPLFVEFVAPADCNSWELCLRLPLDLGEETLPWRSADVVIADLVLPFLALSGHVDFDLGTLEALAGPLNCTSSLC